MPQSLSLLDILTSSRTISIVIVFIALYWGWKKIFGDVHRRHQPEARVQSEVPEEPVDNVRDARVDSPVAASVDAPLNTTLPLPDLLSRPYNPKLKVAISLNSIAFDEDLNMNSEIVKSLISIAKVADLYLLATCTSRQAEERIVKSLLAAGMFQPNVLRRHKLLFTKTTIGRQVCVRHLAPHVCIDADPTLLENIKAYIPRTVCVGAMNPPTESVTVPTTVSAATPSVQHVGSFSSLMKEV